MAYHRKSQECDVAGLWARPKASTHPGCARSKGRPTNPCRLARCKSGSAYEAKVVEPEQMITILGELDTPETLLEWTLALVHAATALRPEEAFGLKWMDMDWDKN